MPDYGALDVQIRGLASREERVKFARQHGYSVLMRPAPTEPGRFDIRIGRREGGKYVPVLDMDCSEANLERITGRKPQDVVAEIARQEDLSEGSQERLKEIDVMANEVQSMLLKLGKSLDTDKLMASGMAYETYVAIKKAGGSVRDWAEAETLKGTQPRSALIKNVHGYLQELRDALRFNGA